MTGEEKVWVAEGSLGLVRAVRATYFFARITAFFTGDAVGCQKTVMLFSRAEARFDPASTREALAFDQQTEAAPVGLAPPRPAALRRRLRCANAALDLATRTAADES